MTAFPSRSTVLLIEDDPGVRNSLMMALGAEQYTVLPAESGQHALHILQDSLGKDSTHSINTIILDVMLPDTDGFTLLQTIKTLTPVPVMMLTAMDEVEWKVKGLRSGADDYLVKPYAFSELLARLEVLERRPQRDTIPPEAYQDVRILPGKLTALRGHQPLNLTPTTYSILRFLVQHPEEVVSREAIMLSTWGFEVDSNTLEVHLSSLRRALGAPPLIHTVRSRGYILQHRRT